MTRLLPLALAATLLGGCVQQIAQSRVQTALTRAGVGQGDAACMAKRMTDRLSIAQLRKLEVFSAENRDLARPLSPADYLSLVVGLDDPELVGVVTSSAALCATGLAR